MIKRLLLVWLLMFAAFGLKAQLHGNEWINYSQYYYKIKIAQNGIYRIDSATLVAAGIPIAAINPHQFQIFNKGAEQKIFVQGESDNVFNTGDFIEFYAEKNDGTLDSALYVNTSFLPNPYYSLINDTAVYYLTWSTSLVNSRMQVDTVMPFSGYSPDNYFLNDVVQEYHGAYFEGATDAVGGTDVQYTKAEGWFDGSLITLGASLPYYINTPNKFSTGPNAIIKTVAVGASRDASISGNDHELKIEYNGTTVTDTLFTGYESMKFTYSVPAASLGSFNTFQFSSLNPGGFTSNRTAVSYINIKYPHTMDLEAQHNFTMYVPENLIQSKSFLTFTNFNAIGTVHLYDLTNGRRINVVQSGTNDSALVANSGGEKKCFITSDGYSINITALQPVTPSAQFTDYAAMATDSAYIIITHKTLMASALNYKNYRSINLYGGNYNVVMADIDELCDQYAFGIVKSPLSIRNFCDHLIALNPTAPPLNLFLIGKSIHLQYCRQDPTYYAMDVLPSYGNPSSDHLLTAGLIGTGIEPSIPTGRLAAKRSSDVDDYLEKVTDYENRFLNPPAEWMKQVLHFGGGTATSEQAAFRSYLQNYETIIEDTLYGGTVQPFYKTNSLPISINTSDTIRDLMNKGVSLITFFGHASGNSFDESIDDINSYSPPAGHYPFMLANGCYSGDIHGTEPTTSELYVINRNKGMIGYLASVGLGIPYSLNAFSTEFYHQIALNNYGKTVGSSIKNSIATLNTLSITDPYMRATCYEMTLHGDPALKLNAQPKPDYKITNSDVYFDMTTDIDSFTVYAVRTNIGRAKSDTIINELLRIAPNGDSTRFTIRNRAPKFKDTIAFKLPINFSTDIGLNKIKITLDAYSTVDELDETNNATTMLDAFVNGGSIVPVYPYEFAIIPNDTITLKASTGDPFAATKNYIIQIDTIDTYNSSLMQRIVIAAPGGVVKWKPALTFIDSTVYYWRVSPDSIDATGYTWRESSFQYIPNKRGWGQSHFFQFKNDGYQFVKWNRPARKFDFVNDLKTIKCKNGIYPYIYPLDISYLLNGALMHYWSCSPFTGITFAVFDPITGSPQKSVKLVSPAIPPVGALVLDLEYGQYGNRHCVPRDLNAFDFYSNEASYWRPAINAFVNTIPNGMYVLAYSQGNANIHLDTTLYQSFESFGIAGIRTSIVDNKPFIFFGIKGGAIGSGHAQQGDSLASIIEFDTTIATNWNQGYIASPVIGPASSWDSLSWKQHTVDGATTYDSVVVRVIGIDAAGNEATLANFTTAQLNIGNLSTYANAAIYPRMRLIAYMKDDTLHTPPQLDHWQVIYTPVPEAAINPAVGYAFPNSTVQEGDNINIQLPIQNISEYAFTDSLLVTYWIEDANRVNHPLPSKLKKKPFAPGEIIMDTIRVNTLSYSGNNALWVEVNPVNQTRSQLEQYHFNNIARIPFTVSTDRINPLLDVTFDGVHILNADIVSAKPNVLIQLKDENQFLALNDTSDFKVFIQTPSSNVVQRIFFGTTMTFIPAVLPNNSCKINYTPTLLEDGIYKMIVQAKDQSDNQSGMIDYKISFEVVNKSTITEVMNYPNPFSTATHFVFTLTGAEVPTYFKIQIMTITGKVVREITNVELGLIHIGRNITDYAWDGKDEFGDQLANGVYLYRVVSSINGTSLEKRTTDADQYFKKGFGKMFLIR
jgi:Peptidase family C25/Interleukin-like EMT inducer